MTDIRIALVGLDHWYSAIPLAEGVSQRPGVCLAGVWDRHPERAEQIARSLSVDRVERDWRALVDDPDVDAVLSFASPDTGHEVCIAAARAGKHVIANKPLAMSLDDAARVVTAVRESGVHLLPAECRQRLGPRLELLRRWFDEGRLGRLESASLVCWAGLPRQWPDDATPGWFADPARTAGGGWIDHAIYQVDLLRWVFREEVTSISAQVANLRHPGLAVEDFGVATVVLSGGAVATLESTWTAPPGSGFQFGGTVVGSQGAIRMDGILDRNLVWADLAPLSGWVEVAAAAPHDQGADIDHWAAVIRGDAEPIATVADAWRNLAVCQAFYDSARMGCTVQPRVQEPR